MIDNKKPFLSVFRFLFFLCHDFFNVHKAQRGVPV
jgi:hypothetical protein